MQKSITLLSAAIALALIVPGASYATNGMFLMGFGAKSRGMGGVAVAMPQDSIAGAVNPATIFSAGSRLDVGVDIFRPIATSSLGQDTSRYTEKSRINEMGIENIFFMPNAGGIMKMSNMAMGVSMVGAGGGGSKYNFNLYNAQTGGKTKESLGVSLMVAQVNPTFAMKLNKHNVIGGSLIIGMQRFKAYGLGELVQFTDSVTTNNLTNNGSDYAFGFGLRLGWLGTFMHKRLRVGVAGATQTYMTKFKKYSELFAEGGRINTPGNVTAGLSFKVTDRFTAAFDINYIMYEDVPAVANLGPNTTGNLYPVDKATNSLGKPGGLGFGWSNQTVYKLGLAYKYTDKWTVRGGWNYAKSPINEKREIIFNVVAPATVQNHLTLGATYTYSKTVELSASYVHAFEFKQNGPTYIGYTGEIGMYQDSLGISYAMKF